MSDLISRQGAIDGLKKIPDLTVYAYCSFLDMLMNMPSVQSEQEYTMEEFMYGQDMGNPEDGSL